MRILSACTVMAIATLAMMGSGEAEAQQRPVRADLTKPTSGWTYFNLQGADIARHDSDVRWCTAQVAGPSQAQDSGLYSGLIGGLVAANLDGMRLLTNVENCMVVRGWRVVRPPQAEAAELGRLDRAELSARLSAWVGAEVPHGEVVRVFGNDAARGDTLWGSFPANGVQRSLSAKAVDLSVLPEPPPSPGMRSWYESPGLPRLPLMLTPENVGNLPPETAVVIIRTIGTGQTNGEGFNFVRMGDRPAGAIASGAVDNFAGALRWTMLKGSARERRETLVALPVVPGHYRMTTRMGTLDLCLGSPVTEIRAGDVVFMGTFDVAGPVLGPDMSLAPAQAFLTSAPTHLSRLRPAEWRNGSTSGCYGVYNYAIEIPGAPFEPGYVGGTAPRRAPQE